PYLATEIEELGFNITRSFATGVELQGSVKDCIKLNLNLRSASQDLYSLETFEAPKHTHLYNEFVQINWYEYIDVAGYFSVTSVVNNEHILTPLYANVKVKDAIVDRIKEKRGLRPNSGSDYNKTVINLYWQGDKAEIFL